MNGIGWFKVHRELLDKAIWKCSTPEQKVILITLLKMVNFRDNEWMWEGKKYKVEPGQMITSLESIMKESGKGISIQNVRTALTKFESLEFLTSKSTNKNRLITIVNWELYQSKDDELTNKLTSNQQATNKQLTTIEESKKEKKEKKEIKKQFGEFQNVFLSGIEYQKLVERYGESVISEFIEKLDGYIASKGTKYNSHYATILNWIKKEPGLNKPAGPKRVITIDG